MYLKKTRSNKIRLGLTTQKVLLLLLGGLTLSLNGSPDKYFKILKTINHDWDKIEQYALHRAIRRLYKSKLIDVKDNTDGSVTMILNKKGKNRAITYEIDSIKIMPMKLWDKKWRIVLFDIPESQRKARVALQRSLKNMGFYQFQKSVFVNPFECQDEIDFVIDLVSLRPYVRYIFAD
jgi:DNA-binding transcriptional regulator PaaX